MKKTVLNVVVNEALNKGYDTRLFCGKFKKYLDYLYLSKRKANNIKVYKNYVFLFKGRSLITMFPLEGNNLTQALIQIKKLEEKKERIQ